MAKLSMKLKQQRPAKFSTRAYTRCRICGRPHSVLRKYGVCRICYHPTVECTCPPGAVKKYMNKVSGPLLDRLDLQIEVVPVPFRELSDKQPGEPSAVIRERVIAARAIQAERFRGCGSPPAPRRRRRKQRK